jgi:ABC-type transporter Mla subunit MlaD
MALQDLTPQLRTRLNRMERAVGWFVLVAGLLLVVGFAYYLRQTAQRKGWFLQKLNYETCVSTGTGLKIGDPVKLMGFDVGSITDIIPNGPYEFYNITIRFQVRVDQKNYPGYIWTDSTVKVNAGDLLGGRFLEITKGATGVPTARQTNSLYVGMLNAKHFNQELESLRARGVAEPDALKVLNAAAATNHSSFYEPVRTDSTFFLLPNESPAVTERLQELVTKVEQALPNILNLTNKINAVLDNSSALASNLNLVALEVQPVVSNVTLLTAELRGPGALGTWALGTNGQQSLDTTLASANQLVMNADTNLVALMESFGATLENLANITSNLNAQVQANTNMLGSISQAVVNTDDLVQGLKRHWLLRSAFKKKKK